MNSPADFGSCLVSFRLFSSPSAAERVSSPAWLLPLVQHPPRTHLATTLQTKGGVELLTVVKQLQPAVCTTTSPGGTPYGRRPTAPAARAAAARLPGDTAAPGSTGTGTDQDGHRWDGHRWGSPHASRQCERSSTAAGSGGRKIRSSCWRSSCTLGAIKAQQWPDFSSVTRSNGTASRIPRNFPFIAAVATEHLYKAEGVSDPAVKYFPNSLCRHKW